VSGLTRSPGFWVAPCLATQCLAPPSASHLRLTERSQSPANRVPHPRPVMNLRTIPQEHSRPARPSSPRRSATATVRRSTQQAPPVGLLHRPSNQPALQLTSAGGGHHTESVSVVVRCHLAHAHEIKLLAGLLTRTDANSISNKESIPLDLVATYDCRDEMGITLDRVLYPQGYCQVCQSWHVCRSV